MAGCYWDKPPKKEESKKDEPKDKEPKKDEPKKEIIKSPVKVETQEESNSSSLLQLDKKQKELYQSLKIYLSQLEALDTDAIADMTYPKFFSLFNKSTFKNHIYTMINSPHLEIQSFKTKISEIGQVSSFSKGEWSSVEYRSTITIYLQNPELYSTKSSINTLYSILVRKYGRENIYVDTDQRLVKIKKVVKMLAIKERPNSWRFIGDNLEYRKLYPNFLPSDILNSI